MRINKILFILMLFSPVQGLAQADDLEEAAGLEPQAPVNSESSTTAPVLSWLRWRGYGLVDYHLLKQPKVDELSESGPQGEVALAFDTIASNGFSAFLEGRVIVETETQPEFSGSAQGLIEQGGIRYRPVDKFLLVLGKERNRRAPGLILSPSDFLHSNQSLPGLREERSGIWLARVSWQVSDQSIDLIALPVNKQTSTGLAAEDSEYAGTVARYFKRFEGGLDLGIDYGRLGDQSKAGLFLQTILAEVWKVYGEGGYDSQSEATSTLLGGSFEGWADVSVRAEWYQQEDGWKPNLLLLHDPSYLILSLSVIELMDRFNLTPTFLHSLSSSHQTSIVRGEWVVDDRQVVGLTFLAMNPERPIA